MEEPGKAVLTCGDTLIPGMMVIVEGASMPCAKLFILVKKLAFSIFSTIFFLKNSFDKPNDLDRIIILNSHRFCC